MKYCDLASDEQRYMLEQARSQMNLAEAAIEKDWWVSQVLKALFELPYGGELSFKGGTSLSKAWGLIDRFSEDVDLGIDREFLGFGGELSRTQISDKLRRAACGFVREHLQYDLRDQLVSDGIAVERFTIKVNITPVSTTDPEIIYVEYQSAVGQTGYIAHTVKIEVSGRSMHEPVQDVQLESVLDRLFPGSPIAEGSFNASVVVPERTFLEKVMLLHEEFAKPLGDIRTERMSRHMYDIYRILQTPIAEKALADEALYRSVLEHRRKFIGLRGFNYDTLYTESLSLRIPAEVEDAWRRDYDHMCRTMIYGEHPSWEVLTVAMHQLNERIRRLGYRK